MNLKEAREFLGVTSTTSKEDIQRKYRELAKVYHPDAGGSHDKFVKLRQACETCLNPPSTPPKMGPQSHPFKPPPTQPQPEMQDFRKFFEEVLGGMEKKRKPFAQPQSGEVRYTDMTVYVSLRDLFCGATIKHTFDRSVFNKLKRDTIQEEITLYIPRRCGFTSTTFCFEGKGKQIAAHKPDSETLRVAVKAKRDDQWVTSTTEDSLYGSMTLGLEQIVLYENATVGFPDGTSTQFAIPVKEGTYRIAEYNSPRNGIYLNVKFAVDWSIWKPRLRPFIVSQCSAPPGVDMDKIQ
jgi:hypothetical protein